MTECGLPSCQQHIVRIVVVWNSEFYIEKYKQKTKPSQMHHGRRERSRECEIEREGEREWIESVTWHRGTLATQHRLRACSTFLTGNHVRQPASRSSLSTKVGTLHMRLGTEPAGAGGHAVTRSSWAANPFMRLDGVVALRTGRAGLCQRLAALAVGRVRPVSMASPT